MLKKGMLGAAFALLVAGAGAFAQKQQVMLDKVVAVVGSSSILHSEVAEYARQLTAQRRAEGYTSDRDPMNEALEALMTQKLLFNQAQIDSVKINAGDIATHVEQQIQNMIETEGSIPKLEAKHHMAIFSIRENMRQRYEEQSYASSMQSEVVSKVSVIPGEVEHFYKSIDKDSLPTVAELVAKGKAFLERLLAMPREEMARDLYLVDTLVSTKRRSSLNNVQENFKEVYQEATEAIESENFERSTVRILYKFYEMYYYNDVQDDLNAVVAGALGKSAGKTMEEASEILYEALEKIMEDDLSADDGDFDAGELGIAGAAAAEQVQQMAAAMQGEVVQMQAAMQEALAKGDMAEYMRLAQEFQQKMMEQALGQQK